jgi:hypothetical protein
MAAAAGEVWIMAAAAAARESFQSRSGMLRSTLFFSIQLVERV